MPEKNILTREALLNGDVERLLQHGRDGTPVRSSEDRAELVQAALDKLDKEGALWVFGYGSLIWNPALDFDEQRCCRIENFQKRFCFWTTMSRGTPELPGLMMGLVEGGNCNGVAYRINPAKVATELDILFRREMSSYVYKETWVEARCAETNLPFTALTFVVDPGHERFVDNLPQTDIVSTIAEAKGPLGRNCDYLFQLSEKLCELGFDEPELEELVEGVRKYQASQ